MTSSIVKILFIGDLVGRPGRSITATLMPRLRREYEPDLVIANGENSAGGAGITSSAIAKMKHYGIKVITSGNHIYDKKEIFSFIDHEPRLIRPANWPPNHPGRGWLVETLPSGIRVGVLNLIGRIFMKPADCPFRKADEVLETLRHEAEVILVDFHAEATAEKQCMGWYLDGRVTAVIGTHTHIPTADEHILPSGTAYITDVGMTGPHDSVIGVRKEQSLRRMKDLLPVQYKVAEGDLQLHAVLVEADGSSGKAHSIKRIAMRIDEVPEEISRNEKDD